MTRRAAADFLRRLAVAVPYRIHTVLTDNGTHFTEPTGDGWKPADIRRMRAAGELFRCHSFELACADLDIEHRLTKPNHPWTNGQVERMVAVEEMSYREAARVLDVSEGTVGSRVSRARERLRAIMNGEAAGAAEEGEVRSCPPADRRQNLAPMRTAS